MKEKDTVTLQDELRSTECLEQFVEENKEELQTKTVPEFLEELLEKYDRKKAEVAKRAGLDESYNYQIFMGKRNAKRDKLIQIAFGFPLTVEETQQLLRCGEYSELYVRRKRDAYLMYALEKGYDVWQVNELLFEKGVEAFE